MGKLRELCTQHTKLTNTDICRLEELENTQLQAIDGAAILYARDALGGCLCAYEDEGVTLPEPRFPDAVPLQPGEFAVMVDIDLAEYRRQTDNRAVRKNVSLPAWMVYEADKRGFNCS